MASHAVPFAPIRTERLLLRVPRLPDLDALVDRRNDPQVAKYQDWTLPYETARAQERFDRLLAVDGPTDGEWWMITIADPEDSLVYGDLALHLASGRRTAEIGYTLAREHWRKGFAIEAASALVRYLFEDIGVTRVFGNLHPDNPASARVLERVGMLFEGHTRLSYWVGDDNSDGWHYGMTRDDWDDWQNRPMHTPDEVRLVEITPDNARAVTRLRTHKTQERFATPVVMSFADALVPEIIDGAPVVPWMRAVEADGELAGFVMLALTTEHHPEPYLWRLMVDRRHQRRGIGQRILDALIDECRAMGDRSLFTSWVEGPGSPRPFYERYGFEPTGKIVDGETEARYNFT